MKKRIFTSIFSFSLFLLLPYLLEAATFPVPSVDFPTVQSAINAAQDGDTIMISPGTYRENLVIEGKLVNLQGEDDQTTILDGGNIGPCLILKNSNSGQIRELTFQNGNAKGNGGEGGGIACYQSSPKITYSTFKNNVADEGMGGGIFCFESSPVIENNEFYQNSASCGEGGAICAFRSNLLVQSNFFIENNALEGEGGAISSLESLEEMEGNSFTANLANEGNDVHIK